MSTTPGQRHDRFSQKGATSEDSVGGGGTLGLTAFTTIVYSEV